MFAACVAYRHISLIEIVFFRSEEELLDILE
jgi:hypothetical protein